MPTITCSECETEFEQTHTKRMTCSPECAKQRHARLDREQKVRREEGVELLIPCAICGVMFRPVGRFRTCGDECSKKLKLETKRANKRKHYQEQKARRKANAKPRQASVDMPSLRAPYRTQGVLGKLEEEWTRKPTCVTPCEAETCDCCGSVIQPWMERVTVGAFTYKRGHQP